jgi:hypothetical protein
MKDPLCERGKGLSAMRSDSWLYLRAAFESENQENVNFSQILEINYRAEEEDW